MTHAIEPILTPPPPEEIGGRLDKVRRLMAREELDYYVAAHTDNVYYLTNFAYIPFERPFFLVIPAQGRPVLIVPLLEVSHARQRVLLDVEYQTYYEFPAPAGKDHVTALKQVIGDESRVGVESSLSLIAAEQMPGRIEVLDLVDEARLVKSDYEVGRIAYASQVVDVGLAKVVELARPGVQEVTFYSEGTREMMTKVVLEIPGLNFLVSKFTSAVWPEALSAQPHSIPGLFETLGEGGPHVAILAAQVDGYSAEVERTFFLGRVDDRSRRLFETVMEARALAFDMVKPGLHAAQVDGAVYKLFRDRGFEEYILHRTGHGFGITGHEPPWVALGSRGVLEPNMVISIEPGLYVPGQGGYRHSDTVLVTEDGCLAMTQFPDRLEDLVLPV
ncbi:MAG: Xaa-Pro peptidase family protein [Proteobacteria bacterium]|nr:Xaa-Pro peptidase family protein [Pseudomonadota bacterium]